MIRKSTAIWKGSGKEGSGTLSSNSGVLNDTPYAFATRFLSEDGKAGTNPEELIAAAHAGCFSMALSFQLSGSGYVPAKLETEAQLKMENVSGQWKIMSIHLVLKADVANISEEKFNQLAENAKMNCPVSQALSAISLTLSFTLNNAL